MSILRAISHAWEMTNPWRPMIRDDRARKVPLYRLDLRWRRSHDRFELPPEEFDRIRSSLLGVTRYGMGGSPWVLWPLAIGYAAFAIWFSSVASPPRFMVLCWAVMIGVFIWSALTYRHRIPRAGRDLIALALLNERRCASCAYSLAQITPDQDGRSICPECGASWRLPEAGQRRAFL